MKSKSNGKQTNETPVSLLEVKVSLPTRVIFGDEAIVEKYDPSELAQIPKLRLGEGTLGTLYKAVLKCGSTVTIRKIREEVARSDDFEFWIKFFGGVRDDSLLTLLFGFWYGGEAFVVYEYFCLGSLEGLLHGKLLFYLFFSFSLLIFHFGFCFCFVFLDSVFVVSKLQHCSFATFKIL